MRKYPKKCSKCKEYMEPIFQEVIGNYGSSNFKDKSKIAEPIGWKCDDCDISLKL